MNPSNYSRRAYLQNVARCTALLVPPGASACWSQDRKSKEKGKHASEVADLMGVFNIRLNWEQALEDLSVLEYVMDTAYSGVESARRHGVVFSERIGELCATIRASGSINTKEFFQAIVHALEGIRDFHLVFSLSYFGENHIFCKHTQAYFTDVVVGNLRQDGQCTVLSSGDPELRAGTYIRAPRNMLFPTLPGKHGETFIVGKMCEEPVDALSVEVDGKAVALAVHSCRVGQNSTTNAMWNARRIGDVEIVACHRLTHFSNDEYIRLRALAEYGNTLRDARFIVLDLRGNTGGDSSIATDFVKNFNDVGESRLHYRKLDSLPSRLSELTMRGLSKQTLSEQREVCLRNDHAIWRESPVDSEQKGNYSGRLIVLTNAQTASSAEILVKICRECVPNCTIVGENTKGCLNTGDIRYFFLPNSLIFLNVPTAEFVDVFEEGIGFLPDLWLDNDEPVNAIAEWLNE